MDLYIVAGGIIGYNEGNITNCKNNARIQANYYHETYLGGIVGDGGNITGCSNTGAITVEDSAAGHYDDCMVGGIVGLGYDIIEDCYNSGNVKTISYAEYNNPGGIVGYADNATINNTYNTGDITAIRAFNSSSGLGRDTAAGGIAGYLYASSVYNSYNLGAVNVERVNENYEIKAGGIAGYAAYNNNVINCYNVGTVKSESDYYTYLGGIFGQAQNSNTIGNSVNYGKLYVKGQQIEGVLCGHSSYGTLTIENSFEMDENSITPEELLTQLQGYVTELPTNQVTLLNWKIYSEENNGYPILIK